MEQAHIPEQLLADCHYLGSLARCASATESQRRPALVYSGASRRN